MLAEIIKMLDDGHTHSIAEMSDFINVSSDMLQSMLQNLVRMGYIKEVSPEKTCTRNCHGCPGGSACAISTTWEITEKYRNRI